MNFNILHITVHLGGGIGPVLLNWIESDTQNKHTIICLNHNYYKTYSKNIVHEHMKDKLSDITNFINKADIVVIHFWNHPLLFKFLIDFDWPECRMCFWSHISGLSAPYVFSTKLVEFSDLFVFASPISYEAKEIIELPPYLTKNLRQVWTTGNIDDYFKIEPIPHKNFNIGFVGTLDYSKLHPNFVDVCSRINIPNVRFIICGGGCDTGIIKQQVKEKGLESKFIFTGVIDDIKPYLAIIDVFGYPLNPNHFGTCEQVLGEAIAAGIIPVVMKNPAEEYILFKNIVRFVCTNEEEYIQTIELLYHNRHKRSSIITLIQDTVAQLYDTNKMLSAWNTILDFIILQNKRIRNWEIDTCNRYKGHKIYIESLGNYGKILEKNNTEEIIKLFNSNLQWQSLSKGSPRQYLETFPEDEQLKEWVELLNK